MTCAPIDARFDCRFPGFNLNVDLQLPGTGITALFGHSGCGKTTLLRCMAGLQRAEGHLSVLGSLWQSESVFVPVHQRPLGYVFQETHLFPHLSVRRNLTYGQRRIAPGERQIRLEDAVDWLGLGHLLDRLPAGLSGGERQRVAMGRAILTSPKLLLMDEPLSALDQSSKLDILPYLERLRDHLSIPIVYVSHATSEVERLADHIVMMSQGRVVADGPLAETLARVDHPFGLQESAGVIVHGVLEEQDRQWHLDRFRFDGGSLWLRQIRGLQPGDQVRIKVMAKDVSIALTENRDQSVQNVVAATIDQVNAELAPGITLVRLMAGTTPFLCRLTSRAAAQLALKPGQRVWMQIKSVALLD
ncbi:MAG: molybdenum ABC transporter ATP-binding protein [Pseudomonadota bacterium]|nr:molybdenum ABC transporter ATP-binding protein [Pseudomonadota bacterium]